MKPLSCVMHRFRLKVYY